MLWGSLCRGSGQLLSGGAPGRVRLPVFLVGVRFPGWFREAAGAGSDLDHVGIGEGPTTGSRERCPADAYRFLGDLHAACLFFAHLAVFGCLAAPTSAGCLRAWVWGGVLGLATVYTSPPSHSHAGLGTLVHDDGVCLLRAGRVRLLLSTALRLRGCGDWDTDPAARGMLLRPWPLCIRLPWCISYPAFFLPWGSTGETHVFYPAVVVSGKRPTPCAGVMCGRVSGHLYTASGSGHQARLVYGRLASGALGILLAGY